MGVWSNLAEFAAEEQMLKQPRPFFESCSKRRVVRTHCLLSNLNSSKKIQRIRPYVDILRRKKCIVAMKGSTKN